MATSRTVLIAGGGIGGLTAALAIAQRGFSVTVFDQAERLEEIGAGIQLSPNAFRILDALDLSEKLQPHIVVPQELIVRAAHSARVLARAPLGETAASRYGAPYWVIHRGDLQAALLAAVAASPDITLELGAKVGDFAIHGNGITASVSRHMQLHDERGIALVAADGLWSALRRRLADRTEPRYARHTAWRALVPAEEVPAEARTPAVNLWLGRDAHLVHYPVKAGRLINVVAIVHDDWRDQSWTSPGNRAEILARFSSETWQAPAGPLIGAAEDWHKWALYDLPHLARWGEGPMTLLGDAAHPMLPFLAQGAAMAIEDAAVLANRLAKFPDEPARAMREYERARRARTARVQQAARRNGSIYHMSGVRALLRALALRALDGQRLVTRYDWLFGWTPD